MNIKIIKSTLFGPVNVIWTEVNDNPTIKRIVLSKPGLSAEDQVKRLFPHARMHSRPEIDEIATAITWFLTGENIEFSLDVVDLNSCSKFQQLVLRAEHMIRRGSVSSYRLIAEHLGKSNGARAVGNALATNPFPLIVPCHRAIRSDLQPGGFQGGPEMKRALLAFEGTRFDAAGRVLCPRFHYA